MSLLWLRTEGDGRCGRNAATDVPARHGALNSARVIGPRRWGNLAHPEGLEPPTPKFVVWCSIQLSYGCGGARCNRIALARQVALAGSGQVGRLEGRSQGTLRKLPVVEARATSARIAGSSAASSATSASIGTKYSCGCGIWLDTKPL